MRITAAVLFVTALISGIIVYKSNLYYDKAVMLLILLGLLAIASLIMFIISYKKEKTNE